MFEIESNKQAWNALSADHYREYKRRLMSGEHRLNKYILSEIGDITGKDIIHLQCNTGADTIALAMLGAKHVTGVDLSPENVRFARMLANDMGIENVSFIESDVLKLSEKHLEKHDMAFTSEGVLGWLPDLSVWAKNVKNALNEGGFLYVFDSHPFYMSLDEALLPERRFEIKYPYFSKIPDVDDGIGGYASDRKTGVKAYFWMHTFSEIINSLARENFRIDFLNEYTENFFDSGGLQKSKNDGLYELAYNKDLLAMSFSLKATLLPPRT